MSGSRGGGAGRDGGTGGRGSMTWLAMALVGLPLVVGCRRHGPNEEIVAGPATLTVENQNFPDYDVYVITEAGQRLRLGIATGHSTATMEIPRSVVDGGSAHLHFLADPVGGRAAEVGEDVVVNPGDQIQLTIAPY